MARARILKPGFFKNEQLAELPFEARLCFAGLWTLADREGRLEDRPKRIDAELFPYDAIDMPGILLALAEKGLIRRYVVDGKACLDIPAFLEHQKPHAREVASELPQYQPVIDGHGQGTPRSVSDLAVSISVSDSVPVTGQKSSETGSLPPFLVFPVTGAREQAWPLTEALIAELAGLFPTCDVRAECRKALAWVLANSEKRKTAQGMRRFLTRWLTKGVDSGRAARRVDSRPETNGEMRRRYAEWTPGSCSHTPPCGHAGACLRRQDLDRQKTKAAS